MDGLEVGILVNATSYSVGVLPDDPFAANDRVCGKTVRYTAKGLSAGKYRVEFDIHDPNSDSNDELCDGRDENEFTIADGQTLTVNATFQLTPKQWSADTMTARARSPCTSSHRGINVQGARSVALWVRASERRVRTPGRTRSRPFGDAARRERDRP
ncbi:MAG TPA: hypothetical protein VHU80_02265 [Polyangiaceae bacterium]|jgi:hypothetical protein|nr:hypothetical protein [Polyangiaceae bacterium]